MSEKQKEKIVVKLRKCPIWLQLHEITTTIVHAMARVKYRLGSYKTGQERWLT